jgi:hypothetical protein
MSNSRVIKRLERRIFDMQTVRDVVLCISNDQDRRRIIEPIARRLDFLERELRLAKSIATTFSVDK